MSEWYMAIGGHQVGPVKEQEILANIRNGSVDANTLVFVDGMTDCTPLKDEAIDLEPGETLRVDTGCLVALQPSVRYDVSLVGGIKTALFGGEGLVFVSLTGPGRVWLQSLPFSRLADRLFKAVPQTGGRGVGEGSILGGIGRMLDGD